MLSQDDPLLRMEILKASETLARAVQAGLAPEAMTKTVTESEIKPGDNGNVIIGRGHDAHYRLLDGSLYQVHVLVTRSIPASHFPALAEPGLALPTGRGKMQHRLGKGRKDMP